MKWFVLVTTSLLACAARPMTPRDTVAGIARARFDAVAVFDGARYASTMSAGYTSSSA